MGIPAELRELLGPAARILTLSIALLLCAATSQKKPYELTEASQHFKLGCLDDAVVADALPVQIRWFSAGEPAPSCPWRVAEARAELLLADNTVREEHKTFPPTPVTDAWYEIGLPSQPDHELAKAGVRQIVVTLTIEVGFPPETGTWELTFNRID